MTVWTGSFGCPQNIKSIFFPPADKYPDNNNYPPNQYPQFDNGYGDYQQQQQYLDNNNEYDDNVRDNDSRDNKKDDYKNSDSRDNKRNDRSDEKRI